MKTVLVLGEHPDFAEAIRSAISREQWRVIARTNLDGMGPFLEHGLVEACGKLDIIAAQSSLGGLIRIALPLYVPSTSVNRQPGSS